jgi:predicted naringenin-chalcone synthase
MRSRPQVVCCEISSAVYCTGDDSGTAIVNSLFGDCVAAVLLNTCDPDGLALGMIDFTSGLFPEEAEAVSGRVVVLASLTGRPGAHRRARRANALGSVGGFNGAKWWSRA